MALKIKIKVKVGFCSPFDLGTKIEVSIWKNASFLSNKIGIDLQGQIQRQQMVASDDPNDLWEGDLQMTSRGHFNSRDKLFYQ